MRQDAAGPGCCYRRRWRSPLRATWLGSGRRHSWLRPDAAGRVLQHDFLLPERIRITFEHRLACCARPGHFDTENESQSRTGADMNHGATIIDSVGRLIPLAGLALFLTLNVFVRSWVQSRRYGSSGVALLHPADLMQWSQAVGMLLVVAVLIVEAVAAA